MRDLAAEQGTLVPVSRLEAENWRQEWRRILRVLGRIHRLDDAPQALPVVRLVPKRKRGHVLPAVMAVPGTWVLFRPHSAHPVPPHLYRVVAVIPAGIPLLNFLTADQIASMDRHTSLESTPRCVRVLVVQMGARRASGSMRAILAGELAARGIVLDAPPRVLECGRLPAPLAADMFVSWYWHSSHGEAISRGIIVGYIPADVPIEKACPGFLPAWGLRPVSCQDRYLVKTTQGKRPYLTPAAHLVEQAFLAEDPLGEVAE